MSLPLEVHVEELSAEYALTALMPAILPEVDYNVRVYRGKHDLMKKLPNRLRGYAAYPGSDRAQVVVLVDRDDDDCVELRRRLDHKGGLPKTSAALEIADFMDVERNTSRSFQVFRDGLRELTKGRA